MGKACLIKSLGGKRATGGKEGMARPDGKLPKTGTACPCTAKDLEIKVPMKMTIGVEKEDK
jgi:hypothetical protein